MNRTCSSFLRCVNSKEASHEASYRFLGNSPNRVAPPASGNCPAHQFSGITLHHCDHKSHLVGPLPCQFCSHDSLMYSSPSEMTFLLHLNNVLIPDSWHLDLLFILAYKFFPSCTLAGSFNHSGFKSNSTSSVQHP